MALTTKKDPGKIDFRDLQRKCLELRHLVLEMVEKNSGHLATSYSCTEILTSLFYTDLLNFNPSNQNDLSRDRFILSKGHGETILYAVLADLGFFPKSWLFDSYRTGECRLGGHPDHSIPGVELTTGSLGHGPSFGAGVALAHKLNNSRAMTYVLVGDAECAEGSIWEALLFSAKWKLDNLVLIIDENGIGSMDFTKNTSSFDPFADKFRAFNYEVFEVDGHSLPELYSTLSGPCQIRSGKPKVILAKTVKGKGVSFLENDPVWHVRKITAEEITQARRELGGG